MSVPRRHDAWDDGRAHGTEDCRNSMSKPTLRLDTSSVAGSGTNKNSGVVINQKFPHGRTHPVTVIVKGDKTGTRSRDLQEQIPEPPANVMDIAKAAEVDPTAFPSARERQASWKVMREKDREDDRLMSAIVGATMGDVGNGQTELGLIGEGQAKRNARQRPLSNEERKMAARDKTKAKMLAKQQLASRQRQEMRMRLRDLEKQNPTPIHRGLKAELDLAERRKNRVAYFSQQLTHGKLPNLEEAREHLEYLKEIDSSSWQERDRDRHLFVQNILTSIMNGTKPQQISQPDGKYFRWPDTSVGGHSSHWGTVEVTQEVGVLKSIGYQVGLHSIPLHERRRLLSRVYEHKLTMALESAYLNEWGSVGSSLRLKKLAHTIASLTRNMKRRNGDAPSIEDWESDLAYLKQRYYDGKYDFPWPKS
jgi:hypothetical protein